MSFEVADAERRERFAEANALLLYLRSLAPPPPLPATENDKSLRGLWLVSLYAAVERSVNAMTEAAITVISSHQNKSIQCIAPIHGIFHFNKVKSLKDCGRGKVFDKSALLFKASLSEEILSISDNPLAESLQNVDSNTMSWILELFGAPRMTPAAASIDRVNTLRERRNAVAHGRESASQVGERYTLSDLSNIYNAADEVVLSFFMCLKDHCVHQRYLRASA
ncbi:MAE_28990/MAE_18760 family HEPN-like nuclease [Brucella pseudogrignonensis]|uniref:HEPN domain-containing protein n=1 Tax=Brucella pseudogrignonensis TaxID=419475 RepID=UPI00190C478D|nr:MAE_28990/MAE_18760 family HEPN-like nuclease [Brucella pseudogrignonensis]MBK0024258.1 hypothetical protein [Ochrobactrum sp. S45]MBK0045884.1 hypothetical protein [Ochrobactrum sp. S46]UKK94912.1 MAE_28990/MAE_18760 family HEPN-like nuclease [Brucella pseudogrignonensis]